MWGSKITGRETTSNFPCRNLMPSRILPSQTPIFAESNYNSFSCAQWLCKDIYYLQFAFFWDVCPVVQMLIFIFNFTNLVHTRCHRWNSELVLHFFPLYHLSSRMRELVIELWMPTSTIGVYLVAEIGIRYSSTPSFPDVFIVLRQWKRSGCELWFVSWSSRRRGWKGEIDQFIGESANKLINIPFSTSALITPSVSVSSHNGKYWHRKTRLYHENLRTLPGPPNRRTQKSYGPKCRS